MRLLLFSDLHLDSSFTWAGAELARARRLALRQTLQKDTVLLEQRPIEPEAVPQLFDVGLRSGLAEHGLCRVAGDEMDQRADERRDAKQYRNREHQAAGKEAAHPGASVSVRQTPAR